VKSKKKLPKRQYVASCISAVSACCEASNRAYIQVIIMLLGLKLLFLEKIYFLLYISLKIYSCTKTKESREFLKHSDQCINVFYILIIIKNHNMQPTLAWMHSTLVDMLLAHLEDVKQCSFHEWADNAERCIGGLQIGGLSTVSSLAWQWQGSRNWMVLDLSKRNVILLNFWTLDETFVISIKIYLAVEK
jgi:hypothetical protein